MRDEAFRELWKECFEDTQEYIRFYFSEKAEKSRIYSQYVGDKLAAMAYFTPYSVMYRGEMCHAAYIVGVAVREEYRRQGRMTRLLGQGMAVEKKSGSPLVYLSPADSAIYEPLGFQGVYWRETTRIHARDVKPRALYLTRRYCHLKAAEKEEMVRFVNHIMQEEKFDLYVLRSRDYYGAVSREMQALNGDVLVFYRSTEIVGAANYIREEGQDIITEMVCERAAAERILESLLRFVPGEEIVVEDSYFLSHLKDEKYKRERQKNPYIMCRMLNDDMVPKKCYINDIT